MSASVEWWCEAYGPPPEGDRQAAEGAWPVCFVADSGPRRCGSPGECAEVMADKRSRVHARIHELAVDDGPDAETFRYLAGEFPTPGTLLGGPDMDGPRQRECQRGELAAPERDHAAAERSRAADLAIDVARAWAALGGDWSAPFSLAEMDAQQTLVAALDRLTAVPLPDSPRGGR